MRNSTPRSAICRAVLEALENRRLLALAAAANYEVGENPVAVATADLNGDGRSDVVVANYFSHSVSVLLGTASGAMSAGMRKLSAPDRVRWLDSSNTVRPRQSLPSKYSQRNGVTRLARGAGTARGSGAPGSAREAAAMYSLTGCSGKGASAVNPR